MLPCWCADLRDRPSVEELCKILPTFEEEACAENPDIERSDVVRSKNREKTGEYF